MKHRGTIFGLLILAVFGTSQAAYHFSSLCMAGDDSYCGLYDKWKSVTEMLLAILTLCTALWFFKSLLPHLCAALLIAGAWNQLWDEWCGDPYSAGWGEWAFGITAGVVSVLLYYRYKKLHGN